MLQLVAMISQVLDCLDVIAVKGLHKIVEVESCHTVAANGRFIPSFWYERLRIAHSSTILRG